jgi:hypothetical protein
VQDLFSRDEGEADAFDYNNRVTQFKFYDLEGEENDLGTMHRSRGTGHRDDGLQL